MKASEALPQTDEARRFLAKSQRIGEYLSAAWRLCVKFPCVCSMRRASHALVSERWPPGKKASLAKSPRSPRKARQEKARDPCFRLDFNQTWVLNYLTNPRF